MIKIKIGYIRVSTTDQNTARQEVLMAELGVEKVFIDRISGKNTDRPELKEMMGFVRNGDTVIVESISRFARNTKDLLELVEQLTAKGVEFVSRKEAIDTTTPTGKFMLTVFGAVAELEREYTLQRQAEGIAIAKGQGVYKGRKDWAVEALEKFKKPYVKGNTYNGTYLQPVQNHLIPHFGDVPLDNILPIHVQEYVNQVAKKYKPETVKKDIAVLAYILGNAVDNGLCKSNPVTKSIRLPKIERADKTAYTQEQYDIAYEFARNHPDGLSIMLLLETGISRSELLGLTWDDFDSDRGIIHIRQGLVSYKDAGEGCVTVSVGLKNEYRRRSIPIVEPELLKRLREKPRQITYTVGDTEITVETTHIFHSPEGKPYQPNNWNNRVFLRYMNALVKAHPEIPKLSAHELRHTRATLWIAQGVSPMMAARLLGHSDLKMLMRIYDHTDVETLRDAITSASKK